MNGIGGFGGRRLAQLLGPLNAWSFALQRLPAADEIAAAREYEASAIARSGIPRAWAARRSWPIRRSCSAGPIEPSWRTGIANIHARDPMAMASGALALAEAFPGRFVLGIGVSHAPSVQMRGGDYGNPLQRMRAYLDAMQSAQYAAPAPMDRVPLVLAALGPRMLELAAERADGAHPYFVPLEHTEFARRHLGPEACLATEQTAVLTTDHRAGLDIARAFAKHYLALPNYANNLRRVGWSDTDIANDGSDRLIEAVIAIGDVDVIVGRIREHLAAGADTVLLQMKTERSSDPALGAYREIRAAFDG